MVVCKKMEQSTHKQFPKRIAVATLAFATLAQVTTMSAPEGAAHQANASVLDKSTIEKLKAEVSDIEIVGKKSLSEIELEEQKAKEKADKEKVDKEKADKEKATPKQDIPVEPIINKDADTHKIQAGDTLSKIAEAYEISLDDLMMWNGLESDLIFIGDELALKDTGLRPVEPEPIEDVEDLIVDEEPKGQNVALASEIDKDYTEYNQNKQSEQQATELVASTPSIDEPKQEPKAEPKQEPKYEPKQDQSFSSPSFNGGSNPFTHGECTWHAFNKRASAGKGVSSGWGNASNWANAASSNGYTVNNTPSQGAIIQSNAYSNGSGSYGHVGFVESVHSDGSITISESNWNGKRYETYRTIPASQVSNHNYIH